MLSLSQIAPEIARQLENWTVFGPIPQAPSGDEWLPLEIEGAKAVPSVLRVGALEIAPQKVAAPDGFLDFQHAFGALGGQLQVSAWCEIAVPEDGTLSFSYKADYYAAFWVDGIEVYSTREGSNETHRLVVALAQGVHVFNARVISGSRGWSLFTRVESWQSGLLDELRTDRAALWRDYSKTLVRFEHRPEPTGVVGEMPKEAYEQLMMNLGVDARWLTTFHDLHGSYYDSKILPMWEGATPEHETQLREWVEILHSHRICAMNWLPLIICTPAWEAHPDWRQKYIKESNSDAKDRRACCINSPYGDALIDYAVESIEKFGFDGVWYDGSFFSPGWFHPLPVSCVCEHCNAKFYAATGLEAPSRVDWSQPGFPQWVKWRYEMFAEYWQKLVDGVHAAVPTANVVFNVYHREGSGWASAIPWKTFGRDFPASTEADAEPLRGAYYTRMMRAYGRENTEVWMAFAGTRETTKGRDNNPRRVVDFAVAACTAGGYSSLGAGDEVVVVPTLNLISEQIRQRVPYLNLPSVPYAALHLSQQTETFVFGRNPAYPSEEWCDHYGASVCGWHHALAHGGLTCDVLFDDHLTPEKLALYPILIAPLAVALTQAQTDAILGFVSEGGTLVCGPWFGLRDEWGEHAPPDFDRALFPFDANFPTWEALENRAELEFSRVGETLCARPLAAISSDEPLCLDFGHSNTLVSRQSLGRGEIVQFGVDLGGLFRASGAQMVIEAVRELLLQISRPIVETPNSQDLILGIFRRANAGKNEVIVHVQQFSPPWNARDAQSDAPPTRWNTILRWNGPKPRAICTALPECGPSLPLEAIGNGWQVVLPPFAWGQVVIIEESV